MNYLKGGLCPEVFDELDGRVLVIEPPSYFFKTAITKQVLNTT